MEYSSHEIVNEELEKAELDEKNKQLFAQQMQNLQENVPESEMTKELIHESLERFKVWCQLHDQGVWNPEKDQGSLETQPGQLDIDNNRLNSDFNIDNPGRYPESILKDMLENHEDNKPWGIAIVAKYDHNGAFARCHELAKLQEDLQGKAHIRIVESDSAEGAVNSMDNLASKYGKFSFALCLAHGTENGFALGEGDNGKVDMVSEAKDEYGSNDNSFSSGIERNSQEGSSLVMYSCSVGKGEEPIAKQIAEDSNRKVIAPDDVVYGMDPRATANRQQIDFDPVYNGANKREFN